MRDCVLDGFGFSYLQSNGGSITKSNVIHAIKWFQVMRGAPSATLPLLSTSTCAAAPLIPLNVIVILVKLVFG